MVQISSVGDFEVSSGQFAPTVFIHMEKDSRLKKQVNRASAYFRKIGVPVVNHSCKAIAIQSDFFHIYGVLSPSDSAVLVKSLTGNVIKTSSSVYHSNILFSFSCF